MLNFEFGMLNYGTINRPKTTPKYNSYAVHKNGADTSSSRRCEYGAGSVQVVRDQTARSNNAVATQSIKTAQMRAVQEARGKLKGEYIDVRDRKLPQRDAEMRSISAVF